MKLYKPNVYLAGKISPNGWREKYHEPIDMWQPYHVNRLNFPINKKFDNGRFKMIGPYYYPACGHSEEGCFSGENSHGLLGEDWKMYFDKNCEPVNENEDWVDEEMFNTMENCLGYNYRPGGEDGLNRYDVVADCVHKIVHANIMFAWIDTVDCFGTIAEIGVFHGYQWSPNCHFDGSGHSRRYLLIAGPKEFSDMWFVYHMADEAIFEYQNVHDAFDYFIDKYTHVDYQSYLSSDLWRKTADEAKINANFRCQVCNQSEKLHAHHRTYERVGYEHPSDIIVLCEKCHTLFHNARRIK